MTPLFTLHQLGYQIAGTPLLDALDLTIPQARVTGLIGPNGSGKSTLLRLLAGLLRPSHGTLLLAGRRLEQLTPVERGRTIAYIPQDNTIYWPITVERVVELGRLPHLAPWQGASAADHRIIDRALHDSDTLHLRHRSVATLSGGERARVMIARALAAEPQILLADEPTAALDPAHQRAIMALLQRLAGNGVTVLLALHDLTLAVDYCDPLILLQQGRLMAQGSPADVLTKHNMRMVYALETEMKEEEIIQNLRSRWKNIL